MPRRRWLLAALVASALVGGSEAEMDQAQGAAALLERGDAAFAQRDYEGAGRIYEQAATAAEAKGERSHEVEALAQVARCYSIRDLDAEGRPWCERAAALADSSAPGGYSRYLLVRGVYEREGGDREQATATFAVLYDYCRRHGLEKRAVDAAHMAAIAAEPEQQIDWGLKGIAAAEAGGFEGWLGPLWNNLGWTYDDLGRYEEAFDALQKAREYHHRHGDDLARLIADWSVGHAHRMKGDLEQAEAWMTRTQEWALARYTADPSPDTAEWLGMSHKERAEIALARGERERARGEFEAAIARLREAKMPEWDAAGFAELERRAAEAGG